MDSLTLILLFPLAGLLVNLLFGWRRGERFAGRTATLAMALSFAASLAGFARLLAAPAPERVLRVFWFEWISVGGFEAGAGFALDPLSSVMTLVITGVGTLIHLYSMGYMRGDRGAVRYFIYLNLFSLSMLTLVLGDNLLVMFAGWEAVGLCSYLLIGFWYERGAAAEAGKKAFVVNRVGDFCFLIALFYLYAVFGSLDFQAILPKASALLVPESAAATAICLLLFAGAAGKSAQIPLYVWLPDAMEGPTPVSALIHAATMVTAGVYMVARASPIYVMGPGALEVIAVVGALTGFFAATIGLAQNDIKRVLAYSTVSQLGFMFMALGVGAFAAGVFHLMTHAFFKGLLFLGSGSVIHALHHAPEAQRQDMRFMGGLKAKMPVTYWTFLVGALAIAGVPPLAGFWSKDEILANAFFTGHYAVWILGSAAAFMTAFYMFRLVFMTFHGETRADPRARKHIHESPASMTVPLVVLAALSVVGGAIPGFPPEAGWIHRFLAPSLAKLPAGGHAMEGGARLMPAAAGGGGHGGPAAIMLIVLAILIAAGGIALAWRMYVKDAEAPGRLAERMPGLYRLLLGKYHVDEIYQACVVEPIYRLMRALWSFDARVVDGAVNGSSLVTVVTSRFSGFFDLRTVDGAVNGAASFVRFFSQVFKYVQSGMVQNYLFVMLLGVFVMLSAYLFR